MKKKIQGNVLFEKIFVGNLNCHLQNFVNEKNNQKVEIQE